jgi:hypothetical protein
MRAPLPADEARAAEDSEGVVKELKPAQPPPQPRQPEAPKPAPKPAPQPAQPAAPAPAPRPATQQPPAQPRPQQPRPRPPPVPPLPEMAQSWFGVSLIDWFGPLIAVFVGVLSIQVFARMNGPEPAATLPAGRYFSPVSRVAALSAKLYDEIKGEQPRGWAAAAPPGLRGLRATPPLRPALTPCHPRRLPARLPARPRRRGAFLRCRFARSKPHHQLTADAMALRFLHIGAVCRPELPLLRPCRAVHHA